MYNFNEESKIYPFGPTQQEVIRVGKKFTGIIKKSGKYYVALCLELNVASQGETLEEAKKMLEDACHEYLLSMKDDKLESEIKPVPIDVLREFMLEDVEIMRPNSDWFYTENFSFGMVANV